MFVGGTMYENSFFFAPFGPGFLDILLFHFVSFLLSKDKFKEATELFKFFKSFVILLFTLKTWFLQGYQINKYTEADC